MKAAAGSTKGKPMIEVYDKDRKKGAAAMLTAAKTYNPAADVVLGRSIVKSLDKVADESPKNHLRLMKRNRKLLWQVKERKRKRRKRRL